MTPQYPERLIYRGQKQDMENQPLETYFEKVGTRPDFVIPHTGLWRGYVATWEIKNGKLYLKDIDAFLPNGRPVTMLAIFPAAHGAVFADWYSGTIRLPQGEMSNYVHIAYTSIYERERLIEIKNGVVISDKEHANTDENGWVGFNQEN